MVEVFSLGTAHHFGDGLAAQARLRFRVFVQGSGLDHPSWDGMEYDQFDTPAAMYFVWRDASGEARGMIRLLPTVLPYMLETFWPHLVRDEPLPHTPKTWEGTRLCVDRNVCPSQRLTIMPEILCALQEYCRLVGIQNVVGVTRKHLIEHFLRKGVRWLGPPDLVEGHQEAAFRVGLDHLRPEWHCRKFGLKGPYLQLAPEAEWRIVA